jgi:phosphatidylglycerophosphate synthase
VLPGRKNKTKYYNKIDHHYFKFVDWNVDGIRKIEPEYFKKNKMSPSMLTAIAFVFRSIGAYIFCFGLNYPLFASICVFLGIYIDFLDGHYARKYNQETYFGDVFDHVSDGIFGLGMIYLFIVVPILYMFNIKTFFPVYKTPIWFLSIVTIMIIIQAYAFELRESLRDNVDFEKTFRSPSFYNPNNKDVQEKVHLLNNFKSEFVALIVLSVFVFVAGKNMVKK